MLYRLGTADNVTNYIITTLCLGTANLIKVISLQGVRCKVASDTEGCEDITVFTVSHGVSEKTP